MVCHAWWIVVAALCPLSIGVEVLAIVAYCRFEFFRLMMATTSCGSCAVEGRATRKLILAGREILGRVETELVVLVHELGNAGLSRLARR